MVTTVASAMTNPQPIDVDEEDDASIDEEQLEEYREMVEQLGSFPVRINKTFGWIYARLDTVVLISFYSLSLSQTGQGQDQ